MSQRRPDDRPQQGVPPHRGRHPNQLGVIRPVIRQSRRVVEKLPHGNARFLGPFENIHQGLQWLSKCQPAVCDQQHNRQCRRQGFGQRGEIEDRFSCHGFLSETIADPTGKKIFNHPLPGNKEYAAGKDPCRHGLLHQIMQKVKFHSVVAGRWYVKRRRSASSVAVMPIGIVRLRLPWPTSNPVKTGNRLSVK